MPLDHYVTLGRSGLRVSPLCLGAMTFGEDLGWGSSVEESQRIIDRFIELGGNFIDTANFYTKGHSEKILGDHVGRNSARRDRLVLATKFSGNLFPGDPNGGGSSRKSIVGACENSLRRVLVARAHRGAGARAHGARARSRDHAVVAAEERRAEREVHAKVRGP